MLKLAAFTLSLASSVLSADPKFVPQTIIELMRHGARAPLVNLFNEAYITEQGPGNLTANGMRMHQTLGQQLRANYPEIFNSDALTSHNYL